LESYIARQLANYRDGARGAHPDDTYGRQMALMASGLDSEKITELAKFISAMSSWENTGESAHSADNVLYQSCAACHGAKGEGNAALLSPRIGGMDARYIATQLRHFRDGVRGTSPSDSPGQTMRAALPASLDDTGIEKLARYIAGM
jgi:cytochrome c oxidase subunit 2